MLAAASDRAGGREGRARLRAFARAVICTLPLGGCASGVEILMDTPVLYHEGALDPFAHLPTHERTTSLDVFYATGRDRDVAAREQGYANDLADAMRLGVACVRFGARTTWAQLHAASVAPGRNELIELGVDRVDELGRLDRDRSETSQLPVKSRAWIEQLNERLREARDPELLVYVHGANVGFYHCTVRAAELTHFAGRDFVPVVFDWPSHDNIVDYVWGGDGARARSAAADLTQLLRVLADHSEARRIHLLCYSAGAVVGADGLLGLRSGTPAVGPARLPIGTVLFAAGDLEENEFLRDLPVIHELAERVTVTLSDDDSALGWAEVIMGGDRRIGQSGRPSPAELAVRHGLPRLEILDVSLGHEERGFDIGGHHYWYRHPWVASDVILNLRLGIDAERRGLAPAAERVWYLPADYPERVRAVALRELSGAW